MSFRDLTIYVLIAATILGGGLGVVDALVAPQGGSVVEQVTNPQASALPARIDILLIGADDRVVASGEHRQGRSDTLILLSLAPEPGRATMLSLPRDLLVTLPEAEDIAGYDYPHKLNAAYAFGGVPLTVRTVERETGIHIDYYAKIDLQAFAEVVDEFGGVEIEVPDIEGGGRGMNYEDTWGGLRIHLRPGLQVLDGEEALGFVRYRKSMYRGRDGNQLGINDLQRSEHQQQFLHAFLEQKVNARHWKELLGAGSKIYQRLDTNLDWKTATALARAMVDFKTQNLESIGLHVVDRRVDGGDYLVVASEDMAQVRQDISAHLTKPVPVEDTEEVAAGEVAAQQGAPPPTPPNVLVLNGCGVPGLAGRVTEALRDNDYAVLAPGNADHMKYTTSRVEYVGDRAGQAQSLSLALQLKTPELVQTDGAPAPGADIVVILGQDYAEAHG